MKKIFVLATAALLVTVSSFAHTDKDKKKACDKDCCKKECKKPEKKEAKETAKASKAAVKKA